MFSYNDYCSSEYGRHHQGQEYYGLGKHAEPGAWKLLLATWNLAPSLLKGMLPDIINAIQLETTWSHLWL